MSPCKDCEKRFLTCHDTCPEYKEWVDKLHARKRKTFINSRSTATTKLYIKRKNATYKGKEYRWMKDKH